MSPAARAGRHIGITFVVLRPCHRRRRLCHTFSNPLLLFNLLTKFDETLIRFFIITCEYCTSYFIFPGNQYFNFYSNYLLAKCMEKGGIISNPLLLLQLHAHKRLHKANAALTESAHKNMFAMFTKLTSRQLSASFTLTCEFGVALPFTMCTSMFTLK